MHARDKLLSIDSDEYYAMNSVLSGSRTEFLDWSTDRVSSVG